MEKKIQKLQEAIKVLSFCCKTVLGSFANCEKRQLVLSCLSVRLSAWNNSASIGKIFIRFDMYFSKMCQGNTSFIKIGQE